MPFVSHSQAGQDELAYRLLVEPDARHDGVFLDVGCCHPTQWSNTYGLEQLGWRGWLLDNDENAVELCRRHRSNPVYCGNAETFNFAALVPPGFDTLVDYLSLDCDPATLGALRAILASGLSFRFITIEHDLYRFGPEPRRQMRQLLDGAGYDRLCGDVCDQKLPFEDWWVQPGLVDMSVAELYRCDGLDWADILRRCPSRPLTGIADESLT